MFSGQLCHGGDGHGESCWHPVGRQRPERVHNQPSAQTLTTKACSVPNACNSSCGEVLIKE